MAFISADRVKETTETTGTGAITLAGASAGYRSFASVMSAADTCHYCIVGNNEWEVGLGTYNTTLARTTVIASSNAGSAVNFSAGTKDVFITLNQQTIEALSSSAWGAITGTLSAQTDLQSALDGKQASGSYAAASHSHAISDVTGLQTALDAKIATSAIGSSVQAYDADLAAIAALAVTDGNVIVGNGSTWVVESGATARTSLGAAGTSQTDEQISGFIASPSDKSYTIALKMAHGGTITETTTESVSGTCTATFKINSTALGGTANSVSSSRQSQAHSSSNTFVAGDDIVLTVSSNSSCVDMSFTIKYTRVLA